MITKNFNLGGYTEVTSGYSCGRINSKAECEKAARELGLSDIEASEENESEYPPYCYFGHNYDDNDQLWFNSNGTSLRPCSSEETCICTSASES